MSVARRSIWRFAASAVGLVFFAAFLHAEVNTKHPPAAVSDGYAGPRTLEAQKALAAAQNLNSPNTYGTQDPVIYELPAAAFAQADAGMSPQENGNGSLYDSSATAGRFFAPLNLPSGSLVNFLDLYFVDSDASNVVQATLFSIDTSGVVNFEAQVLSNADTGFGYNFTLISPPLQIDNSKRYMVYVYNAKSSSLELNAVNVWYHLQVSPAPGSATFGDVPTTDPGFQYIEALVASGITAGCGGGNYCPDGFLTRRQMAVFLSKGLGLHFGF